ncbi:hypothetical protein [Acinetobacter sp. CIP-A165]
MNEKGQLQQVSGQKLQITAKMLDNQQGRIGRAFGCGTRWLF